MIWLGVDEEMVIHYDPIVAEINTDMSLVCERLFHIREETGEKARRILERQQNLLSALVVMIMVEVFLVLVSVRYLSSQSFIFVLQSSLPFSYRLFSTLFSILGGGFCFFSVIRKQYVANWLTYLFPDELGTNWKAYEDWVTEFEGIRSRVQVADRNWIRLRIDPWIVPDTFGHPVVARAGARSFPE